MLEKLFIKTAVNLRRLKKKEIEKHVAIVEDIDYRKIMTTIKKRIDRRRRNRGETEPFFKDDDIIEELHPEDLQKIQTNLMNKRRNRNGRIYIHQNSKNRKESKQQAQNDTEVLEKKMPKPDVVFIHEDESEIQILEPNMKTNRIEKFSKRHKDIQMEENDVKIIEKDVIIDIEIKVIKTKEAEKLKSRSRKRANRC